MAAVANNDHRREYLLSRNEHFHIIYGIIKANPGIMSGRLWKTYNNYCTKQEREPVAHRTFSLYLRKLTFLSLITTERAGTRGNVRKFRVSE